jgi:hypothetical protein
MREEKPFVVLPTMAVALILLTVSALAEDIPAKGTPAWIEHTLDLHHQAHTWTYNEASNTYTLHTQRGPRRRVPGPARL